MIIQDIPDIYYENTGFTHIRRTVRGIIKDEDGQILMLHIVGEDAFGKRNHYETPGGGVEVGESYEKALHRELEEELGVYCEIESFVGVVVSHYNLLERINVERYYSCKIVGTVAMHRTVEENLLINEVVSKSLSEWLECLKTGDGPVDRLVHARDYAAFEAYARSIQ